MKNAYDLLHPGSVRRLCLESTGGGDGGLDVLRVDLLFVLVLLAAPAELLQALLPPPRSPLGPVAEALVLLQARRAAGLQAAVEPVGGGGDRGANQG